MNQVEVRLIRMDVPTPCGFFCTLYANQVRIGIISSTEYDNPSSQLKVPHSGTLKLTIGSHTCLLGSVSFPSNLITESGCVWLPVLPSGNSDYIDTLPEEIQSPKLLLYFDINPLTIHEPFDELTETRLKLEKISQSFEEFIRNSKTRELILLRNLEEKEIEVQDFIDKIKIMQNKISILGSEKKELVKTLNRVQEENSADYIQDVKEELEITRQELFKAEHRNDLLMKKLEDVQTEWNFYEEESKYLRETELLNQIIQLRHEVDLKNQEIQIIKTSNLFKEISNKQDSGNFEIAQTMFMQKDSKNLAESFCNESSLKNSFVLEDESTHQSLLLNSRGVSPNLKENIRKTPKIDKSKSNYKFATISSNNKSKFTPLNAFSRTHKSVDKRNK